MQKETGTDARSVKREEMVKYAYALFYKNGFHATGVDTILEGTGISKRTLYKHFISKEGLIVATLDHYQQTMFPALAAYVEKSPVKSPVEKALRIFDFLAELVDAGKLDGCFAMNARTEYANKAPEITDACEAYAGLVLQLVERYLKEGNVPAHKTVAMQVVMLFEGAITRSKATGTSQAIKLAKAAARAICNQ